MKDKLLKYLSYTGTLILGLLVGWLFFSDGESNVPSGETNLVHEHKEEIWTCSMHPQIRSSGPGKCPICSMDLVPLEAEESTSLTSFQIELSENARKIANVSTMKVSRQSLSGELFLGGKIMADERKIAEISSHIKGRIEKLNVNFTGQKVRAGQVLATVYSPELVSAQQELIQSVKIKASRPEFYNAAAQKLRLWGLSQNQIDKIEKSGKIDYELPILSPISGTVTKRKISLGQHVMDGTVMFEVANLNSLWVIFDAYESDLSWIKPGQKVHFNVKSLPGKDFTAAVNFIDPFLDPQTRVARVRAEIPNNNNELKPDMLVKGKIEFDPVGEPGLVVPSSSILWTGKKSVVYVHDPVKEGVFSYREIETGAQVAGHYLVLSGLEEGEEIAVNGVFKIDAAAQLNGKKSMMNDLGVANEPVDTHDGHPTHQSFDNIPKNFQNQISLLLSEYLKLEKELFSDNNDNAESQMEGIRKALQEVDMKLVKGEAHKYWMTSMENIGSAIDKMKGKNLDGKREGFSLLSDALINVVKSFGVPGTETLYIQYCPMANKDQGGYWLSTDKEIQNPYFGSKMPGCGEIKDSLMAK